MSDQAILVTGAAGFIGARFVESCNRKGLRVISVDKTEYFKTRLEHRNIDFGKIVDREELFDFLKSANPSLHSVVHLGACSNTMQLDERYLRRMNLEYSQALWGFCTERRIPLCYASSAATYGDGSMGYDDDESMIEKLRPLNPYGESKRLFDLWALEQEKNGHTPPCWSGFKFFNVYGFGERHKNRMASVVLHSYDQIREKGEVKLFQSHKPGVADGEQKRDFIYVDDVTEVLHFASSGVIKRGIFNLGTGTARTFLDLTRATFAALGKTERITFIPTPEPLRERYQYFTEARMTRLRIAGYGREFTSLETGVKKYIDRLNRA